MAPHRPAAVAGLDVPGRPPANALSTEEEPGRELVPGREPAAEEKTFQRRGETQPARWWTWASRGVCEAGFLFSTHLSRGGRSRSWVCRSPSLVGRRHRPLPVGRRGKHPGKGRGLTGSPNSSSLALCLTALPGDTGGLNAEERGRENGRRRESSSEQEFVRQARTPELVVGRLSEVPGRGAAAMLFWSIRISATPCGVTRATGGWCPADSGCRLGCAPPRHLNRPFL